MKHFTVLSLTLVTCLSVSAASHAAAWDRLGPNGGRIAALCAAPSDPRVVYAGGAFLFRSTDGGVHWSRTADVFPSYGPDAAPPWISAVCVSPKDANRLAVISPQGLFVTSNGGASWKKAASITAPVSAASFSLDGKRLYASVGGTLYRSLNSGDTWDSVPMPNFTALCWNARNGAGFVGARAVPDANGKNIYRTDDGSGWYPLAAVDGTTISALRPGLTGDVFAASGDANGGVWKVASDGSVANVYSYPVVSLTVSYTTPTVCILAAPVSGSPAVVRSFSAGSSWEPLRTGFASSGALSLALGPALVPLAGTERSGVLACDVDNVWRSSNIGLAMASLTGACQPSTSPAVLVAAAGNGLYRSTNSGETWAPCHPSTTRSVLAASPARSGRIWHVGAEGIEKSDDSGQTWQHFTTGLPATVDVARIVPHPTLENTVWLVTGAGAVYQNSTGNPNWALRLAAWTSAPIAVPDLVISPAQPATMYAVRADGLHKSTDSGAHWSLVSAGIPVNSLLCAHPTDSAVIYRASTLGTTVWLHRSTDGGATWSPVRQETGAANSGFAAAFLAMDNRTPGRILLGTNRGLRISDNNGSAWRTEPIGTVGTFTTAWAPCKPDGDFISTAGAGLLRCRPPEHSALIASDVLRILRLAMSPETPSAADLAFADLNGDGTITMDDADLALRSATGP